MSEWLPLQLKDSIIVNCLLYRSMNSKRLVEWGMGVGNPLLLINDIILDSLFCIISFKLSELSNQF